MKLIGNKRAIHSPEFHKKKEKERKIRRGFYIILAILIAVTPIVILRQNKFLISKIQIQGNQVTKTSELEAAVSRDLAGDYLWLIPRASALFYPKKKLLADVLSSFPRLSSAEAALDDSHSLTLNLTERAPAALYCRDISQPQAPTGCYFIDDSGYIFSSAPAFSGGVYVAYSSDPVLDSPVGQQFLPSATFAKVRHFAADLALQHLEPATFLLKDIEYDVALSAGPVIMLKAGGDLDQVESNLTTFVNDPTLLKGSNTFSELLYIDLRFGNKVFYKFKNE